MADQLTLELATPTRLVITAQVDEVVAPGSEGYFGVLPGHAPFISQVRPGVIDVYENGAVTDRIFVAGGFAEVSNDHCTVLAEEARPVGDLDRSAAEADLREQQAKLAAATGDAERAAAESGVAVAEARLAALSS